MNFNMDKIKMHDEIIIQSPTGELFVKSNHATKLVGELVFETLDLSGNVLFTSPPEYNDIVITGSTMVLEKIFGVRANLQITTLSNDMNINPTPQPSSSNLPNEYIMGFMVGVGGAGETIGDVAAVSYTQKALTGLVPFRAVATPLATSDAAPYFMVNQVNGNTYYYGKTFDNTPQIRHLFTDGTEVPANICDTGTTKGIRAFGEVICVISATDLREYFTLTDGNINNCRINTIGLVSSYPATTTDVGGVRIITTINFKSRYLSNNEDSIRITYRVYAM